MHINLSGLLHSSGQFSCQNFQSQHCPLLNKLRALSSFCTASCNPTTTGRRAVGFLQKIPLLQDFLACPLSWFSQTSVQALSRWFLRVGSRPRLQKLGGFGEWAVRSTRLKKMTSHPLPSVVYAQPCSYLQFVAFSSSLCQDHPSRLGHPLHRSHLHDQVSTVLRLTSGTVPHTPLVSCALHVPPIVTLKA